ncbi:hypothetical protein D917_02136 [Trichinella nativa]|uniref:Uncharacterized protein n=1 Tax=Trichinella nativa TaxID=6335 RepID=A0A1Y3EJJ0_9BILA|nr:hypothetical protein D917_02136 [Trichinella nativa]
MTLFYINISRNDENVISVCLMNDQLNRFSVFQVKFFPLSHLLHLSHIHTCQIKYPTLYCELTISTLPVETYNENSIKLHCCSALDSVCDCFSIGCHDMMHSQRLLFLLH